LVRGLQCVVNELKQNGQQLPTILCYLRLEGERERERERERRS
jgi:hypothetical protein